MYQLLVFFNYLNILINEFIYLYYIDNNIIIFIFSIICVIVFI